MADFVQPSTTNKRYTADENLAMRAGVKIETSMPNPTGRGSRDPQVLLNETAYHLDGQPLTAFLRYRENTYDTYDGHNAAHAPDWYTISFPAPTKVNCVDMTMECAHRDGGWWTSLTVELQTEENGVWLPAHHLSIEPPYTFDDVAYGRKPYETFSLKFEMATVWGIRLIGRPGGLAHFTSLARLAVYERDFSQWDPAALPVSQTPSIFRLMHPRAIWDLSESLVKLTGLAINVQSMDHYLDKDRYEQWWQRISRNYLGEPELWYLVGVAIGWDAYFRVGTEYEDYANSPKQPYVRIAFHNTLACAVAPIVVDGHVLAEMTSHTVVLSGSFDEKWHRRYATDNGIPWDSYMAAVRRSPNMTYEQLEGAATLMGMIVNTITNLAYLNQKLERQLGGERRAEEQRKKERQELVQNAITFMKENLEAGISIHDVAQSIALSPTYFGTMFTEEMGRSPLKFLNELRLERAKQYLAHTDMSVLDVSLALGYNANYFSRFFQRHTGYTPIDYIRKMRKT